MDSKGNLKNGSGLLAQIAGEKHRFRHSVSSSALVTMIVTGANREFLEICGLTGAGFEASFCTEAQVTAQNPVITQIQAHFRGLVMYPICHSSGVTLQILPHLRAKHGLWQDLGKCQCIKTDGSGPRLFYACGVTGPGICLCLWDGKALLCDCIWGITRPWSATWFWKVTRPCEVWYQWVLGSDKFWPWLGADSISVWVSQDTKCPRKQPL